MCEAGVRRMTWPLEEAARCRVSDRYGDNQAGVNTRDRKQKATAMRAREHRDDGALCVI